MSISSTNSRNNYTGNNTTATYNYTFRILDQDDLLVTVRDTSDVETTLAITTDYTVTGVGSLSGGTIVLTAGNLATGYVLSIRRVVPLVQETDIRNQGAFYPEIHEDQFDRQVMMAQQQQDEVDRSVKLAETIDPADFDTRLPASIVGSVNQTVMTNATGDGFEPGPTANEVANAQGYATAAAASQAAAAASAASAAASAISAAASQWNDVQYLTSASSPFTVTDAMAGTMFEVDASGGAVTLNLPAISGLTLSGAWSIGIKKTDSSANAVTASRNGTDTIDGATTKSISQQYAGFVLIPDIDPSPDKWTSISFGELPIVNNALVLTDISTPSTPSSGFKKVYSKSNGLYLLDSSGVETFFQSNESSGTYANLITAGDAEASVSSIFVPYADAAAATPADGTGGSPTVTTSLSSSSPLFGLQSFLLTKPASNVQGQGWAIPFSVSPSHRSGLCEVEFDTIVVSGTFSPGTSVADGDVNVFIYDVTNATLITPMSKKISSSSTTVVNRFKCCFATSATGSSYRLILHQTTTSANAYVLKVDNVRLNYSRKYSFSVYNTSGGTLTNNTYSIVTMNQTEWDELGKYNTSTGEFSLPWPGRARVSLQMLTTIHTPVGAWSFGYGMLKDSATIRAAVDTRSETNTTSYPCSASFLIEGGPENTFAVTLYRSSTTTFGLFAGGSAPQDCFVHLEMI
jgi:hypothetical protein